MKKKKGLLIAIISIIVIAVLAIILYFVFRNTNNLTVAERNWINANIGTIQNINVVNNANVFGKNGEGVFYDFLADFEHEYSLTVNPITFNIDSTPSGVTLGVKKNLSDNDIVMYADHYVLISKKNENIFMETYLAGKQIGILSNDLSYIATYLNNTSNVTLTSFDTIEEINTAISEGTISYIIVPLMEYLDTILSDNYYVVYHLSDAKIYYTLQSSNDTLSNVLVKYYNKWQENLRTYYNQELFNTFTDSLKITDTEIDALQSVEYNYGFVNASPYEVITGGKYGGIIAVILSDFSEFAGVDFNFSKYDNYDKFNKAIASEKIDLYFNYYNFADNYNETNGLPIEYAVVARRDNDLVVKSINSLIGQTVYVAENSKIGSYVSTISGISVKTFAKMSDLFKLNKKDVIIVLDKNTFDYYQTNKLDNYTLRYTNHINGEYNFKVRTSSALYNLLNKYIGILDSDEVILRGLNNHYETVKDGGIITHIAEYILLIILVVVVILLIIFKRSKKIIVARKIKREDKMKFIDQLTSLKNRNFLSENIELWSNNTIYPQTVIVVDLNKIQEINDQYGYEEGDKQIKACANVLVKTQLDNSEILRTDGNEFVIYLVGYNQKQITNYIHKLNKEINKLPYDFGAEFGYSMINDNIKTIEDALNEAVEDMKKQKEKDEK